MASFTQELDQVVGQLSKERSMNRLEIQSARRFVVYALAMSLVVVVGAQSAHAVPLPPPTISHIAANDIDADNKWENEIGASGTTFDWTMGSSQSPVTGIVDSFSSITAAYQYPAAVGTSASYDSFQSADATFEMWFRPANLMGEHVLHMNGGGASAAITLDDNVLRFGARRSLAVEMTTEVPLSAAATARFNHIVGVIHFNDAGVGTGTIDLYLNGEFIMSDSVAAGLDLWTGSGLSGIGDVNGSTFAGDFLFGAAPTDFDGQIGIFNFYNSALDADQVTEAYNNFFTPPPVPEPSTFLLLGLGLPALMRHRRRTRS